MLRYSWHILRIVNDFLRVVSQHFKSELMLGNLPCTLHCKGATCSGTAVLFAHTLPHTRAHTHTDAHVHTCTHTYCYKWNYAHCCLLYKSFL